MTGPQHPRAWLLMAAGRRREFGGNTGYDDQADVYYTWDSTVNNHANISVGDAVALWYKERLLGISVIEAIETTSSTKVLLRCPRCERSTIKSRAKLPTWRCQNCQYEFDHPLERIEPVTEYRSRHDAAWTSLDNLLGRDRLRSLCNSPKSQLSMRSLDWPAFRDALRDRGADTALSRIERRTPDFINPIGESVKVEFPQGHSKSVVRVRRGQRTFREHLLAAYGGRCAFTGSAPNRVLDAGHLYSYAELGHHHQHGGLLLRRDVHRHFDDGSLTVNPSTGAVDVARDLQEYPQYARLHDQQLHVDLQDEQIDWLDKHWCEHRAGA